MTTSPLPTTETAESQSPVTEAAPTLMDRYADGLMNDLFGDVEQILDTGLEPPEATIALPEPPQSSALVMPDVLTTPIAQPLATQPQPNEEMVSIREELDQVRRQGRRLDVLLLGAALGSLALTVGIWAVNRYYIMVDQPITFAPPPSPEELQAASDQEFLTYLQRSLEVIDRRSELQSASTGLANNSTLPAMPAAPSPLPGVPVPSQPTALLPAVPNAAPANPTAPVPQGSTQGTNGLPFQNFALRYGAPTIANPASPLTPSPSNPAQPALPPTASAPTATITVPTTGNHKLIGVVQVGDDSAALFEVDGATQRIGIGETIGASGWSLVAVTAQEAIIRRNGDIRSIHLQQSF